MSCNDDYEEINEAKTNMDHIYDAPDPRAYFSELKKLNYIIPTSAKPVFSKLISMLRRNRTDSVRVLDIGCSYGVNAALLKHDLSMPELYQHWSQDRMAEATHAEVVEYEQQYFDQLGEPENIEVIGLDQAKNAVEYAEEIGLLDEGLAMNLETEALPDKARSDLASVDLVMSTGCVGYVTEKTFDTLMPAVTQEEPPWLANFVLRMFPFDKIEGLLDQYGYATEKLEGEVFVQREFASQEEQTQIIKQLSEIGIDSTGMEAQGHLLAEFYLSRPKDQVKQMPLEELLRV